MSKVNLFEASAFNALVAEGLEVRRKERIVVDKFITLEGVSFDADDLYETLELAVSSDIVITYSRERIEVLKKLGILESEGNRRWYMGARLGTNGETFLKMLAEKLES